MSKVFKQVERFARVSKNDVKVCKQIYTGTSPIVINVPIRGLLAVETKDSFLLGLAKFKYQKTFL